MPKSTKIANWRPDPNSRKASLLKVLGIASYFKIFINPPLCYICIIFKLNI